MAKKESDFQHHVIERLTNEFPGCLVYKNDPRYIQGIPDLSVLIGNRWILLEVKKSYKDRLKPQPNQETYIDILNKMSYASFIYPENEEEVFTKIREVVNGNDMERPY